MSHASLSPTEPTVRHARAFEAPRRRGLGPAESGRHGVASSAKNSPHLRTSALVSQHGAAAAATELRVRDEYWLPLPAASSSDRSALAAALAHTFPPSCAQVKAHSAGDLRTSRFACPPALANSVSSTHARRHALGSCRQPACMLATLRARYLTIARERAHGMCGNSDSRVKLQTVRS